MPIKDAATIDAIAEATDPKHPAWELLIAKVGQHIVADFMYMGSDKGTGTVHLFKHRDTRAYIRINREYQCFRMGAAPEGFSYVAITDEEALKPFGLVPLPAPAKEETVFDILAEIERLLPGL